MTADLTYSAYARHRKAAGLTGQTHRAVRRAVDVGLISYPRWPNRRRRGRCGLGAQCRRAPASPGQERPAAGKASARYGALGGQRSCRRSAAVDPGTGGQDCVAKRGRPARGGADCVADRMRGQGGQAGCRDPRRHPGAVKRAGPRSTSSFGDRARGDCEGPQCRGRSRPDLRRHDRRPRCGLKNYDRA